MFHRIAFIVSVLFSLLLSHSSNGQCAMCKAANEDNLGTAEGFNAAILFLMGFPYLIGLVVVIIFVVYWRRKKA